MKRWLIFVCVVIQALVFTACNDKNEQTNNKTIQENIKAQDVNKDEVDKVLAKYGLNLKQIAPLEPYSLVETDGKSVGGGIIFRLNKTEIDKTAYYEKIFNILKDVSDDGKIYKNEAEFTLGNEGNEGTFNECTFEYGGGQYGYIYKGKNIVLLVQGGLDHDSKGKEIAFLSLTFNE